MNNNAKTTKSMRNMRKKGIIAYNQGLIRWIVLIVAIILVLSYFSIDLRGIVEKPETQENFAYVWGFVVAVWGYFVSVWDTIRGFTRI